MVNVASCYWTDTWTSRLNKNVNLTQQLNGQMTESRNHNRWMHGGPHILLAIGTGHLVNCIFFLILYTICFVTSKWHKENTHTHVCQLCIWAAFKTDNMTSTPTTEISQRLTLLKDLNDNCCEWSIKLDCILSKVHKQNPKQMEINNNSRVMKSWHRTC